MNEAQHCFCSDTINFEHITSILFLYSSQEMRNFFGMSIQGTSKYKLMIGDELN